MLGFAPETPGQTQSPQGTRSHLLEIDAVILQGELRFTWGFSPLLHQPSTIARLAQRYCEHLRTLLNHCLAKESSSFTPSDFPELTIDQTGLDRLLDEVQSGLEE